MRSRPRVVSLIADLEGICGVDSLEALVWGGAGAEAAVSRMNDEVAFVARLLLEAGATEVRISDAHRSGAPANLDPSRLPAGCSVHVLDDMYGGPLLDGVDAVACVGMHASGRSLGFGAHCVSVSTAWSLAGRALTETHLAQLLAAERGVPLWFSAGDDVLARELGPEVPFVVTKHSASVSQTRSRPLAEVEAAFRALVHRRPAELPVVPRAPLAVRFQTLAEARAASEATGVSREGSTLTLPPAATFAEQYTRALALITAGQDALAARVKGGPDDFARLAAGLFLAPWE